MGHLRLITNNPTHGGKDGTVIPIPTIDHTDRMRQHLISQFQWEVIDGKIYGDKPVLRALL